MGMSVFRFIKKNGIIVNRCFIREGVRTRVFKFIFCDRGGM